MLKVLGSMLILLASVGFGFQIQMDLRNHLRLLYDIRKLLFDIANETAYTMDSMEVVLLALPAEQALVSITLIRVIVASMVWVRFIFVSSFVGFGTISSSILYHKN